jgi:hypothetical protein
MAGVTLLRKVQMGPGASTTTIWRGTGVLDDQREVVFPEEHVGYLSRVDRSNTPKLAGAITLDGDATYEQIIHVMNAGIAAATGAADSTGSGKIYIGTFPTTAANVINKYAFEGGDNQQAYGMGNAFVQSFTLSGAGGEPITVSSEWIGDQVVKADFGTAATLPEVESINFGNCKLYIDPVANDPGDTPATNTFLAMNLNVNTGWRPVFTGDGNKYYSFAKNVGPDIVLEVTFEHDAVGVARFDDWQAETPRLIRVMAEGSALTTAGDFSKKTMIFDMAGKLERVTPGDQDGNDIVTATFRGMYNATAGLYASMTVVNEVE